MLSRQQPGLNLEEVQRKLALEMALKWFMGNAIVGARHLFL